MIAPADAVVVPAGSVATFVPGDGSDMIVFDEATCRLHRMGGSAGTIWVLIDGARTTAEVIEMVAGVYGVAADVVPADVMTAVARFVDLGLVSVAV